MVWADAPQIEAQPLDSPNMVAVLASKLPPRPFLTPRDVVRPPVREIDVPAPPAIPTETQTPVQLVEKLPPRTYVPPTLAARSVPAPDLAPDAPHLEPLEIRPPELSLLKMPPRPFMPPRAGARTPPREVLPAGEAPDLAPAGLQAVSGAAGKLPSRPFSAPAQTGTRVREVADAGAPPVIAGVRSDLNIAIVGLKPGTASVPLPAYSNPAAFSGGEKIQPEGATSDGKTAGLTVPNLFARNIDPDAARRSAAGNSAGQPTLLARAYASPTSPETLREALRSAQPITTVSSAPAAGGAPEKATAAKVSGAPTSRFDGRDVYMMAIQMPNLTSYSGSWLMWYADRAARVTGLAPIAPPLAHRKVDPKYFSEAVDERKEGTVQLFCVIGKDGTVSNIEMLKGFDPRLDASAREALAKWEFYPAMRQNEPVEVEVVVEIPFRVAPRLPAKR
jgi:TonB family protein